MHSMINGHGACALALHMRNDIFVVTQHAGFSSITTANNKELSEDIPAPQCIIGVFMCSSTLFKLSSFTNKNTSYSQTKN